MPATYPISQSGPETDPTVPGAIQAHNEDETAHPDIRQEIETIELTPGPRGPEGPAGPNNLFIQETEPETELTSYVWVNTGDDPPTLWVEDGS